ncbi:capsule biosynthesis protein CapD [Caulobacter sp. Root487D2Y]|uniref:nucleoside-diphosphate sugar epimerase/dehydratase n=1 Tax=Caulobacter sp. Root487D2Y TaxID=1736547 RepID=UPI000700B7C6|nr:nucleoside-diphosphate sugar epimerase/dehydratase [Caulobacter sp. Root487D2Y]KQY29244.1 capsule biosynthesis protein CapD [Caulobacter sp. Root487D2Y]
MGRMGKIAAHMVLAFVAMLLAQALTTGATPFTPSSLALSALALAALFAGCALLVEILFQVERSPWRFFAASDGLRLARSALLAVLTFALVARLADVRQPGGLRTLAAAFLLLTALLAGLRIVRRALHEQVLVDALTRLRPAPASAALPRLLIVGSASEAEAFLRAPAALGERYAPVGVLTPEARETGDELGGVCILGAIDDFDAVMAQLRDGGLQPSALLFLTDGPLSAFGTERLGRLKTEGVRLLRRQGGLVDMGAPGAGGSALREISLEELLSRAPVRLDPEPVRALVAGKRVLVTGAGGSIGSELARQIAASGPAQLTLLDAAEANLFHIDRELGEAWPQLPRRDVLCDVRDAARLDLVFAAEKPELIFHAAALKHVTLVENHPCEGVRTNVLGSRNVAAAAKACGAAHLALISTDKAVAPASVMGATKRVAEALVRQFAGGPNGAGGDTRVSVVRFGNVLGSAGSVVPIFQHQIARGGPVTLTDAEVERYFMTIPEAVQLVLRAVALSAGDVAPPTGVLTLEMGEPVKIIDLARRMIELQGLVPERDIEIKITGLRPGEKLTEALVDVNETARPKAEGVTEATPLTPLTPISSEALAALEAAALAGDEFSVRVQLFALVEQLRAVSPDQVASVKASPSRANRGKSAAAKTRV